MFCVLSLVEERPTFNSGRRLNPVITFGLIQFWAEGAINRYFLFPIFHHISINRYPIFIIVRYFLFGVCLLHFISIKWYFLFPYIYYVAINKYFIISRHLIFSFSILLSSNPSWQPSFHVSIILPSTSISTRISSYFHFTFKQSFLASKFPCFYYIAIN